MSDSEKEIYTSLEEAKEEIWRRWDDQRLWEEVARFVKDIPPAFNKESRAVLWRHIISPNNEVCHFLNLATRINLKPIGFEYLYDKFCTRNADKVALGKMPFYDRRNGNEHVTFQYRKIIDLMTEENKPINEIMTVFGENLVDFHHRLLMSGLMRVIRGLRSLSGRGRSSD